MKNFRTMVIYLPDQSPVVQINLSQLPKIWNQSEFCNQCQKLGSKWFQKKSSLLLRVPSAVIPHECNFVINTLHEDYKHVKLIDVLPFYFDKRL